MEEDCLISAIRRHDDLFRAANLRQEPQTAAPGAECATAPAGFGNVQPVMAYLLNFDWAEDGGYQRPLDQAHVNRLVKNFDEKVLTPCMVSLRDGKYWVYDGQHRIAAMKKLFGPDVRVPCIIRTGLTREQEAVLFETQSGITRNVSRSGIIHSRLNRGEHDAVTMAEIARHNGFELCFSSSTADNRICAVAALDSSFRTLGPSDFDRMLSIIRRAWGGSAQSTCKQILDGMTRFLKVYGDDPAFSDERMVKKLQDVQPNTIVQRARTRTNTPMPVRCAREILLIYNKAGRNSKLPDRIQ